MTEVAADTN